MYSPAMKAAPARSSASGRAQRRIGSARGRLASRRLVLAGRFGDGGFEMRSARIGDDVDRFLVGWQRCRGERRMVNEKDTEERRARDERDPHPDSPQLLALTHLGGLFPGRDDEALQGD